MDREVKFPLVSDMFHLIRIRRPRQNDEEQCTHNMKGSTSPLHANMYSKNKMKTDLGHRADTERDVIREYLEEIDRKRNFECE